MWFLFTSLIMISQTYGLVCNYNHTLYQTPVVSDKVIWNRVSARYANCSSFESYPVPFQSQYHVECLEDPVQAGFVVTTDRKDLRALHVLSHSPPGVYQFLGINPIAHLYTACVYGIHGINKYNKPEIELSHPLQRIILGKKDNVSEEEEREDDADKEKDKENNHRTYGSKIPFRYPVKRFIGPHGM
jgi:hypothetical protein